MTGTKKVPNIDWKHRAILAEGRLSACQTELDAEIALKSEWQERAEYAEKALAAVNELVARRIKSGGV